MREKNRKPIASYIKLPQFTTMNVIDGQAGVIIYSSLICYSLTIDNILNIIVILILAGVLIATLTGDNGLLTKAGQVRNTSEKGEIEEQIKLAYNEWKIKKETGETIGLKTVVENRLKQEYGDSATVSIQGKSISINVKSHEFTLIDDGTIEDGQLAYLDIADGTIQLYKDGYIQGSNEKILYGTNGGSYLITGTATEKYIRICDEGTFNITIKDLNIDMSTRNGGCPFNANGEQKETGCFVNLTIEGNNYFISGKNGATIGAGIGFTKATPNVEGKKDGSTLTIQGNGYLETELIGGGYGGTGDNNQATGSVSNIIINSGTIKTIDRIGGGLYSVVNNIIINGGNIDAGSGIGSSMHGSTSNIIINGGNISACKGQRYGTGIGAYGGTADNIIINGGNIIAEGGESGVAIGGTKTNTGKIQINGGKILASRGAYGTIKCKEIIINGGVINANSTNKEAIICEETGTVSITGGNILARGKNFNIATYSGSDLVAYIPKKENIDLYETKIKINGVEEGKKVTSIVTSDSIEYGIKDMYTLADGIIYLYLPKGERTIIIRCEGKTYSGTVTTSENGSITTLQEV